MFEHDTLPEFWFFLFHNLATVTRSAKTSAGGRGRGLKCFLIKCKALILPAGYRLINRNIIIYVFGITPTLD